jgi:kinetochore protein Mis12/MTW1
VSNTQRLRATKRLDRLSILKSPSLDVLGTLPQKLNTMYASMSTLPPLDATTALSQIHFTDPGKRQWETSKTGYLNWAVGQLLEKAKEEGGPSGSLGVDGLAAKVNDVGPAGQLRAAAEATDDVNSDLDAVGASRTEEMEE